MKLDQVILVMLSLAILLAFSSLARGPSLADRVVALDLLTSLVLALITFMGTVAFARFIEKGDLSWRKS